jgi:hypothetical protein
MNTNRKWNDEAYSYLKRYTDRRTGIFLCEEFRMWATSNGMRTPSDDRAWGGVIRRGVSNGLIKNHGVTRSNNDSRNRGFVTLWEIV